MCGIAGYKTFGDKRPSKDVVEALLLGIESRGTEATGVAFFNDDDSMRIIKGNVCASKFVDAPAWKDLIGMPKTMIMHTRKSTKGEPENNLNNHPIFSKNGVAVVHNGVVSNDDELFHEFSLQRDGEVDSEILLRLIDIGWWNGINKFNCVRGTFAVAAISKQYPNELVLIKKSEPIEVYIDKVNDILYFASTTAILESAFVTFHRGFRIDNIVTHSLRDDYAIRITDEGLMDDFVIKTIYKYTTSSYGNQSDWYKEYQNRVKGYAESEVWQ
jgi:glutamine---fructose-6-phosphate transaminase (isomerizing)